MDEKQRRERRSQHGMLEFRGRLPRRLTARVLLGDHERDVEDLLGQIQSVELRTARCGEFGL